MTSTLTETLERMAEEYANDGCYLEGTPVWRDKYEAYLIGARAAIELVRAEEVTPLLDVIRQNKRILKYYIERLET